MLKKFREEIEFTYWESEEGDSDWVDKVSKMLDKKYEVKEIGRVNQYMKFIKFEKFFN